MTLRTEYPRPQLVREDWQHLNGTWQFDFDDDDKGAFDKWFAPTRSLSSTIEVPFAYQTPLSGINDPSFHDIVWYKRKFSVDRHWQGKRVLLHFGAVDYRAFVYVNGKYVGMHEGGHTPFQFDITEELNWSEEEVTVRVEDPSTDETIPRGKQYWIEQPAAIWYTRTTGIWQTVWLEAVDETRVDKVRWQPDLDRGEVILSFETKGSYANCVLEVDISFKGVKVVTDTIAVQERFTKRAYDLLNRNIFRTPFHHDGWTWTPENPNLFDVTLTLKQDDQTLDQLQSYFGLRKIHTEHGMVYLNNKPYYQKLVLDQGYWPEGLLTAPSDEALRKDVELAKAMGFNGCRKHQKVEDPRFLYWADRLGFLVWGECPASPSYSTDAVGRLTREWMEIMERDFNHPSLVAWVPLNESWGVPLVSHDRQQQHHSLAMYHLIKSLDPTRPVISNDGWELTQSDICAVHNYNHGEPEETDKYAYFKQSLSTKEHILRSRPARRGVYANGFSHRGEPILLTEFGGIAYRAGADSDSDKGWGYTSVTTGEDFLREYRRVIEAVYASQAIHGFCYTQLTDVEQEINGLLTYDRQPKCDIEQIRKINSLWHLTTITDPSFSGQE
ncbi:glycoside hydrolase family 2 protein [Paenibacillus xerothermodurans]|uniref:Glycoside hydrolase family 2 n=1 Tax=Paenibacillus xerothermodurans TaxID=1977292 RepID=A0A2W1NWL5_PAEXE|nr:sugar-binding domain-containing protein [Paenibacillus xerothermodurans]PZE20052.1 glycoside hydrolase family 2 [Paenibacillus xerothermodurans]